MRTSDSEILNSVNRPSQPPALGAPALHVIFILLEEDQICFSADPCPILGKRMPPEHTRSAL